MICPFMSCRTVKEDEKTGKRVPAVILCVKEECAIWDQGDKVCSILSLKMTLTKGVEQQ